MLNNYLKLMRFDKPIGIFLLLWPTLWALWIAGHGTPQLKNIIIFILGTVIMRAAGCVINDIADRNFDLHVQRTQARPLTAGKVTLRGAIICFCCLSLLALLLVLQLNWIAILLSVPALLVACIYPFMKRIIQAPQIVLGVAFSFGIPMAFASENSTFTFSVWILVFCNIIWVVVYDTIYAMVDKTDDIKIGIKSTAILFGYYDLMVIGVLQFLLMLGLFYLGWYLQLKVVYFIGLLVVLILCIYHQWLIRNRNRAACLNAFLNNNYIGLIIFLAIAISYLI